MRKKVIKLRVGVLVLLVIASTAAAAMWGKNSENRDKVVEGLSHGVEKEENTRTKDSETKKEQITDKTELQLSEQAAQIYERNKKLLVLVNKDNKVPQGYESELMPICQGRLEASSLLYDDLKKMLEDADHNGYSFFIASAYRSKERQQYLVNEDVEAFMNQGMKLQDALEETLKETMPSGYSEHQTGLALDILTSENLNMDRSQETEEGNKWLRRHCASYGFILRYPEEKESVTRISYEPWHFRYVGKEAAEFIMEHGLTLEEFFDMIDSKNLQ